MCCITYKEEHLEYDFEVLVLFHLPCYNYRKTKNSHLILIELVRWFIFEVFIYS